jgi:hypothetical protein
MAPWTVHERMLLHILFGYYKLDFYGPTWWAIYSLITNTDRKERTCREDYKYSHGKDRTQMYSRHIIKPYNAYDVMEKAEYDRAFQSIIQAAKRLRIELPDVDSDDDADGEDEVEEEAEESGEKGGSANGRKRSDKIGDFSAGDGARSSNKEDDRLDEKIDKFSDESGSESSELSSEEGGDEDDDSIIVVGRNAKMKDASPEIDDAEMEDAPQDGDDAAVGDAADQENDPVPSSKPADRTESANGTRPNAPSAAPLTAPGRLIAELSAIEGLKPQRGRPFKKDTEWRQKAALILEELTSIDELLQNSPGLHRFHANKIALLGLQVAEVKREQ